MQQCISRCLLASRAVKKMYKYYSAAVDRLRFQVKNEIDTMCVDCNLVVYMNEKFVEGLDDDQLAAVLTHEIMHYISAHHKRYHDNPYRESMPREIHNIAMDMEINQYLTKLPPDCVTADKYGLPTGKCYEEYLILLKDKCASLEMGGGSGSGNGEGSGLDGDGCIGNNDVDISGYSAAKDGPRAELAKKIDEERSKTQGTGTDFSDMIRHIPKVKYNWKKVFHNVVTAIAQEVKQGYTYRTYERVNKRMMSVCPDILMPAYVDYDKKLNLVIGMDISGSMGELTTHMYSVMKSIVDVQDMTTDITILEVNSEVERVIHNFDLNAKSISSGAGGGTDMGCIGKYVDENKMNPDLIIVMTDNYTGWDPVMYKNKTVVLTDNVTQDCPYKQYLVEFNEH